MLKGLLFKMILNPTTTTYDNLLLAYRILNDILFDGVLPTCLITLQRDSNSYGYFCNKRFVYNTDDKEYTDEIALNPQYFRYPGRDDRKVVSTLAHEMCHLWQHHYGKPGRARYHNKEWSKKMRSIGLIPSHTGMEGGKDTGDQMTHYIDEKGLYNQAFKDLKIRGFTLEWIENQPDIEDAIEILKAIGTIESSGSIDSIETGLVSPATVKSYIKSQYPPKIDTSKIKYTCPECKLNVWAKLGANIKCGDCDESLIQSSI